MHIDICLQNLKLVYLGKWSEDQLVHQQNSLVTDKQIFTYLLPSATKLRRLCFHRRVSVHRGVWSGPGGAWSQGGLVLGMPAPGGVWSRGGWYASMQWGRPSPRERRLLLRTVRMLMECILVVHLNGCLTLINRYFKITELQIQMLQH